MNKDKDFLGTEPVGKLMFRLALPLDTFLVMGHLPLPESVYVCH